MLEDRERRNYAPSTIRAYLRTVEHFACYFRCPPDRLVFDYTMDIKHPSSLRLAHADVCEYIDLGRVI